ncbi:MAG: SDR family oxidoreductase, partial [Planctomycetota bacterium]
PDLRESLSTNVDGVAHLVELLRTCERAGLLHLSTCYAAGRRDGRIAERLVPDYTPREIAGFDAGREREALHELVRRVEELAESPEVTVELRRQAVEGVEGPQPEGAIDNLLRKARTRWVRRRLTQAGIERAEALGWPNIYTFTKSLGESLIQSRGSGLPVAVVRPSIVESSTQTPFRGWNEGINTSAPMSYLLGTYFRQLPTNARKPIDVVPVDLVCRGMSLIAAAVVARAQEPVYQLATSASNPCDMRRCIELTGLAHRKHYRAQRGIRAWLKSRLETIPVSPTRYRRLSAPAQIKVVRILKYFLAPFREVRDSLERMERSLEKVQKLIELYEPFILHNDHAFEADRVELLSHALVEEEKPTFGYDAAAIDWWEYWIEIHIPALRRWSYPLIEGRPPESRPPRSFRLPQSAPSPGRETVPT